MVGRRDSLPAAFLDRLREIVPAQDFGRVLASFSEPRAVGFRVNPLRTDSEREVIHELQSLGLFPKPADGLPAGYTVPHDQREALLASAAHDDGRIYVQDLASQLPPVLLDARPGERVLDLCAAPGSKTGQLWGMMGGKGELAAVELSRPRFFRMRANLERQGAGDARTFHRDGSTVWRHRPDYFDRVLVDAPCSTEGRFRVDDEDSTRYWHAKKPREMARKQRRLVESAVRSLRPGGVLVYSTCTFAPEENEGIVDFLLERFGDGLRPWPMDLPSWCRTQPLLDRWQKATFTPRMSEFAARLLPTEWSEAFFVARFVRAE